MSVLPLIAGPVAPPTLALSLRQPWADAIFIGKRVENRVWNSSFRGDFYIHASKHCAQDYYDGSALWMLERGLVRIDDGAEFRRIVRLASSLQRDAIDLAFRADAPVLRPLRAMSFGGIVGRARMIDVYPPTKVFDEWHMQGQFGFVLRDRQSLPFVACRGLQRFFRVPADVLAQIGAAA